MSSSPSKSQSPGPLHNFSLPDLKWSSSRHRGWQPGESSSQQSPSPSTNAAMVPPPPPPPPTDAAQRPITLRVLIGGKPVSSFVSSETVQPLVPENANKVFSSANYDRCPGESSSQQSPYTSPNAAIVRPPPPTGAAQRPTTLRVLIGGKPISSFVSSETVQPLVPENANKAFSSANYDRCPGESSSQQSPYASPNAAIVRPPPPPTGAAQRPTTVRVLIGGKPISSFFSSETVSPSVPENADKAFSSANSYQVAEKASVLKGAGEKPESSKQIRSMKTNPIEVPPEEVEREDGDQEMGEDVDHNTWNLRPRKPQKKSSTSHLVRVKVDGGTLPDDKATLPQAAEDDGESKDSPKKLKWPTFSLSLTPQEIEEDIFAMTGSKPSRKPKRRPKAVQRQLDNIFPGMWLESLTPDAYKIPEASKTKNK